MRDGLTSGNMKEERYAVYGFPCCNLKIGYTDNAIRHILFTHENAPCAPSELSDRAADQLHEYFSGKRRNFDLPLEPSGTAFQKRVWKALVQIPYGETRSYKDIAEAAGSPKAFRAVGQANHNNPISIVIPCHRVISSDGGLGGYGGGLKIKKMLLELERASG